MQKVCVVAPLNPHTGNWTTAHRLAAFFDDGDALVISNDGATDSEPHQQQFRLCLMIHALRSGLFVWPTEGASPRVKADKYVVIFGGTDVNVFSHDPLCHSQMQRILDHADTVVSFSDVLAAEARSVFTRLPPVLVIRQSCFIPTGLTSTPAPLDAVLIRCGCSLETRVALLPGGIRRVKGQRFAVDAWGAVTASFHLLLVGPVIEDSYLHELERLSCFSSGRILLHEGVDSTALLTMMMDPRVECVLNTSESEGQSQAVLESMMLRRPVVVRSIPANLDLVDSSRGYVVSEPGELAALINNWQGAPTDMLDAASQFVENFHSAEKERSLYRALVHR